MVSKNFLRTSGRARKKLCHPCSYYNLILLAIKYLHLERVLMSPKDLGTRNATN